MDQATLQQLAQLVIQGMVSVIFIWAWSQERKERQDQQSKYSEERANWMKELISLAREAYGLRAQTEKQIEAIPQVIQRSSNHGGD